MRKKCLLVIMYCIAHAIGLQAQAPHLFFRQLTVAEGLNDGLVFSVCQDKYGYMWFGTLGGINRWDGYSMKIFSHQAGDSSSASSTYPLCMTSSKDGRLWIGFEDGLMEFDYRSSKFRRVKALGNVQVNQMLAHSPKEIYLATNRGLALLLPQSDSVIFYRNQADTFQARLLDRYMPSITALGQRLWLATQLGVVMFDTRTKTATKIEIPELLNYPAVSVAVDSAENIFVGSHGINQLLRLPKGAKHAEVYNQFIYTLPGALSNNIGLITRDNHNNIWVLTAVDGLMLWRPKDQTFAKYQVNPNMPGSPASNQHRSFYEDREGTIWLGSNHGINYFNPGKTLFRSIMPFADSLDIRNRRIARGMAEDAEGNLWFGTGDGVSMYQPLNKQYRSWSNVVGRPTQVYYNSIRATAVDGRNDVWVATGSGINKYNRSTGKMDFIDPAKLPRGFYFSANHDKRGRVWFGTRDYDGFYWYDPADDSYHGLSEHPKLQQLKNLGGRYFLEDSKGRYWFGFNGNGVAMYDSATQTVHRWSTSDSVKTVIGDVVVDIKEDRNGIIWVSTMSGLTGIDPERKKFNSYNSNNGLLSNSASALAVDKLNRLWIATPRGIMMLDSSRKRFTSFGIKDGLPTNEFPEHPGYVLRSGEFMFPSNNGYVRFDPLDYSNQKLQLAGYITGYSIFNRDYDLPEAYPADTTIQLKAGENFFTIKMLAINLANPSQTWYAYKLVGLDKDWHYSQDRKAVYTNVPGGSYRFVFKASNDPNNWDVTENSIGVRIASLFYKTVWFWTLIAAFAIALILFQYRYRISKERQLYNLENKAQLLEQEKTRVMYESLKQQLNPHFLFNSLTSLSGLIETDQRLAASFLDQMSKIYRYILKNRNSELVSVKEEVEFVKLYIRLQQTRFKKGLFVHVQIDDEYLDHKIAPVTIQNMVENAIKHNIIDNDMPLTIDIYTKNDYLVVKNNLQKKEMVETSNRQGLASLESLYRYLSSRPIIIEQSAGYFIVSIPLIND